MLLLTHPFLLRLSILWCPPTPTQTPSHLMPRPKEERTAGSRSILLALDPGYVSVPSEWPLLILRLLLGRRCTGSDGEACTWCTHAAREAICASILSMRFLQVPQTPPSMNVESAMEQQMGHCAQIMTMEICKAPTLRLKALSKHSITHITYIEMEMLSVLKMYIYIKNEGINNIKKCQHFSSAAFLSPSQ